MQSVLKEFFCMEMKSPTLLIILGWAFLRKMHERNIARPRMMPIRRVIKISEHTKCWSGESPQQWKPSTCGLGLSRPEKINSCDLVARIRHLCGFLNIKSNQYITGPPPTGLTDPWFYSAERNWKGCFGAEISGMFLPTDTWFNPPPPTF
jgi:hypothetical protein